MCSSDRNTAANRIKRLTPEERADMADVLDAGTSLYDRDVRALIDHATAMDDEVAALLAERDRLDHEWHRTLDREAMLTAEVVKWTGRHTRAKAEVERMRPVVEAAAEFIEHDHGIGVLSDAVDVYHAWRNRVA